MSGERSEPRSASTDDTVSHAGSSPSGLVVAEGLSREYPSGDSIIHALRPLDLTIPHGSLVAVHGRSGSGKTTLLNLIGCLDRPTTGTVRIDGRPLSDLPERDLVEVRRRTIGYVFQTFGLIPILTAAENVEVPLRLCRVDVDERRTRVEELLDQVGLARRAGHRPQELSGGEQQRVAIARALATRPRLLVADEPTGQLDSATARTIMTLVRDVVVEQEVTAIVATHDAELIDLAGRVVELRDGAVVGDHARR